MSRPAKSNRSADAMLVPSVNHGTAAVAELVRSVSPGPDTRRFADLAVEGKIAFRKDWPPFDPGGDPTWSADPYQSASWRLYFHGLMIVDHLLNAFSASADEMYLLKARDLATGWLAAHGEPASGGGPWNEHSTASRSLALAHLQHRWRMAGFPEEEITAVNAAIAAHGEWLTDAEHYVRNNHGVIMDDALLKLAAIHPDRAVAERWFRIAMERIHARCREDVTPSGVHKEHSPFYHLYFMKLLMKIRRFLIASGTDDESLEETLALMRRYLAYIARDDLTFPLLGDTRLLDIPAAINVSGGNDELAWVVSRGERGTMPDQDDVVFSDAGVAIFRSGWMDPRPVSIVFTAAVHSTTHKHADDLSFVLRVAGVDVLIDGGSRSYDRHDSIARYLKQTFAHNTLTVDGASYSLKHGVGKASIDGFELRDGRASVWGSHRLYDGVVLRRRIDYQKPDRVLLVDEAEADSPHDYTQTFNIGERMQVEGSSRRFVFREPNAGVEVTLLQVGDFGEVDRFKGQTDPPLGWASHRLGEAHPVSALHFTTRATSARFVTQLLIKR